MADSDGDTPGGSNGSPGSGGGGERAPRDIAAQAMIDAFGGIRPMAARLGIPVSTVQGWKQRDTIPGARVGLVESAAAEHGIALPAATPPSSAPSADAASTPPAAGAAAAPPSAGAQSAPSSTASSEVRQSPGDRKSVV